MAGKRSGSSRSRGGSGGGRRKSGAKKSRPSVAPLEPNATPPDIETFRDWNLCSEILDAIEALDIVKPTPIQALAIGPVLEGRDVIAKAETGTGKTLAFGAPMMSQINPRRASVLGLVLSPTRELADQVFKVLETIGKGRGIKVAFVVGGEPQQPQIEALKNGAQVVVGTPGRVLDLLGQRFLSFPWTEFAVLDEADKMLEIGFLDDIEQILKAVAPEAQKLLFSATFPPDLLHLARQYTKDPVEVATASGLTTVDTIAQSFMRVDEDRAFRDLSKIIEMSADDDTFMVFCHRRTDVSRLMRRMERKRYSVKALHGGYEQDARFTVMEAFRRKEVKALIATDIASRGLDVKHVTHVVNYGAPRDTSDYTHRIGRTGRAGREGTALTLVFPQETRSWSSLLRGINWKIREIHAPRELFEAPPADAPDGNDVADSAEGAADETPKPREGERAGGTGDGGGEDRPRKKRRRRSRRRRSDGSGGEGQGPDSSNGSDASSASSGEAPDASRTAEGGPDSSGEPAAPKKKRRRRRRRKPGGDGSSGSDSGADSGAGADSGGSSAGSGDAGSGERRNGGADGSTSAES